MKNNIFISHANPEDNFFGAWLASKLRLFGYNIWIDVSNVKPGNYFNNDYEKHILNSSICFIPIISANYIEKARKTDSGVMNEILCARTVKDIDNFIIPIRIDNSSYDDFPVGIRGRSTISFTQNWAEGLTELLKYFEEIKIEKNTVTSDVLNFWYEAQNIISQPLVKKELYYTNWFEISLPEHVFIYKTTDVNEINCQPFSFVYILEGDRIITFTELDLNSHEENSYSINLFKQIESIHLNDGFEIKEPTKKLVKLLNKTFSFYLKSKGLRVYPQANKKELYFFANSNYNRKLISLKKYNKGRRAVIGTTSDYTWYFAISHNASLFPTPCYRIFYHLVFTDIDGKLLDQAEQHTLRRSLASSWFNRKWMETLISMIYKISDFKDYVDIHFNENSSLKINILPINIFSDFGYKEPQ